MRFWVMKIPIFLIIFIHKVNNLNPFNSPWLGIRMTIRGCVHTKLQTTVFLHSNIANFIARWLLFTFLRAQTDFYSFAFPCLVLASCSLILLFTPGVSCLLLQSIVIFSPLKFVRAGSPSEYRTQTPKSTCRLSPLQIK